MVMAKRSSERAKLIQFLENIRDDLFAITTANAFYDAFSALSKKFENAFAVASTVLSKIIFTNNNDNWANTLLPNICTQLKFMRFILYGKKDYSNDVDVITKSSGITLTWSPIDLTPTHDEFFSPEVDNVISNWVNFNFYYLFNFCSELNNPNPIISETSPILKKALITWRKNNCPDKYIPQPSKRCIDNNQEVNICASCSPSSCSPSSCVSLPVKNINCSSEKKCCEPICKSMSANNPANNSACSARTTYETCHNDSQNNCYWTCQSDISPVLSNTAINSVVFNGENSEYFNKISKEYFNGNNDPFDLYNGMRPFKKISDAEGAGGGAGAGAGGWGDGSSKKFLVKSELGQQVNWWFAQTVGTRKKEGNAEHPTCSFVKESDIIDGGIINLYKQGYGVFLTGVKGNTTIKWINDYTGQPDGKRIGGTTPRWTADGVTVIINFYNKVLGYIWKGPPEDEPSEADLQAWRNEKYHRWLKPISKYEPPSVVVWAQTTAASLTVTPTSAGGGTGGTLEPAHRF